MKVSMLVTGLSATVSLTACGATSVSTPTASKPSVSLPEAQGSQPANPVPILRETGVKMATAQGPAVDIEQDRFDCAYFQELSGGIGTGEEVRVYTFRDPAAQQADLQLNTSPSDGSRPITLTHPLASVWVTPVQDANGNFAFPVPLSVIAGRVHGVVSQP